MKVRKFIPKRISRKAGEVSVKFAKNSPHILFGLGVVGVVGGTVLACKATLKLPEVLDEIQAEVIGVKTDIAKKEQNKDLVYVYGKGVVALTQLYGPALLVGGVSLAALGGAHSTLTKRNTSLTLAYAGLHRAYEEYRERIRLELGEDREKEIYHDISFAKEKHAGKTVEVPQEGPGGLSPYARCFDESASEWQRDAELNQFFLRCNQDYVNNLLHSRGHVFLNDVYDSLGLSRTSAGQIVGWVDDQDGDGDGYIDFGMYEPRNSEFISGREKSVWLDFNVDGIVYDLIG